MCLSGDGARAHPSITWHVSDPAVAHALVSATCATRLTNVIGSTPARNQHQVPVLASHRRHQPPHLGIDFAAFSTTGHGEVSTSGLLLIVDSPMTSPCLRTGTRQPIRSFRSRESLT